MPLRLFANWRLGVAALGDAETIHARVENSIGYPGFPTEAVFWLTDLKMGCEHYPRPSGLQFDRTRADGELRACSGQKSAALAAQRTGSDLIRCVKMG